MNQQPTTLNQPEPRSSSPHEDEERPAASSSSGADESDRQRAKKNFDDLLQSLMVCTMRSEEACRELLRTCLGSEAVGVGNGGWISDCAE